MSLASIKTSWRKAETSETFDALGPHIQFLTTLSDIDDGYCVIRSTFPAGVIVPIHSHGDRETFYILDGALQALQEDHWVTIAGGDIFDVAGNIKHAFRNASGAPVSLLFVTTMRMGRFFRDIGRPAATAQPGPRSPRSSSASSKPRRDTVTGWVVQRITLPLGYRLADTLLRHHENNEYDASGNI
jgi:quercetin dioxygenase-like cupin family protein